MVAQVTRTHVEEDRRSWRAMSLSKITRTFNKTAVEDKKCKEEYPKKREKIIRIEGRERVEQFADHCDEFNNRVEGDLDTIRFNTLCEFITGDAGKTNRKDLEQMKDRFARGV